VIKGTLLKPIRLKAHEVEVTLLPDNNLGEERRKDFEPIAVGTLEINGSKMVGLISIPIDALPSILQMLIGGCFRFLAMNGTNLYRRSTRLSGFRLEMTMQEEDEQFKE
jgi:hypothetical protein